MDTTGLIAAILGSCFSLCFIIAILYVIVQIGLYFRAKRKNLEE